MRVVVVREYGRPAVLTLARVPGRTGPGRAIGVQFAGVDHTDVRNRIGDRLGVVPSLPGWRSRAPSAGSGTGRGLSPGQPVAA